MCHEASPPQQQQATGKVQMLKVGLSSLLCMLCHGSQVKSKSESQLKVKVEVKVKSQRQSQGQSQKDCSSAGMG